MATPPATGDKSLRGIDYNTYSDPKQLLDMLALGNPTQINDVINKWKGVEENLETYNGSTTATGGGSFNGTTRGLLSTWSSPQAADRYSARTGDVSKFAMDLMNGITYKGVSGQNDLVSALTSVRDALQHAQETGVELTNELVPETGSLPSGDPIWTAVSCQQIVDLANQILQQYHDQVLWMLDNPSQAWPDGGLRLDVPKSTFQLPDQATVEIAVQLGRVTSRVATGKPSTAEVSGTVTVTQPSYVTKPLPGIPLKKDLQIEGLTAHGLYPYANEGVRFAAATALNVLASEYAKAAAKFPRPVDPSKLPQGVGGTGTNGGGYGAPPVPATGGVSPPVTDGVNDPKSNNGVTPLDNGSTNGATPTNSPLTDSGLNNSGPTDSGLANSGLTNPVTGSGLTDTTPPTSVAGFTPPGTSGLGLTTPTPSSGLGSTNLPLTNVPTTGFTPSGGGIGGALGSSGGVPLAAGLMPGLYGGTGASSGYPAEEGLGTAARQAASESALLNGESAAANAARSPGMYPPMFPPQMGQGSNERNRSTFLPEEDVWTEDLDVAPPLIVGVSR